MASCRDGVHLILLPVDSLGRKQTHTDLFCISVTAINKRLWTVSEEAEYAGQSRQEAKTGGPVYTLCYMFKERVYCIYLVKTEFLFSFQNNFKHEDHLVRLI